MAIFSIVFAVPVLAIASPLLGGSVATRPNGSAVYKIAVRVDSEAAGEGHLEWIAPSRRAWKMEAAGRVRIFSGDTYAVVDSLSSYVRIGSASFLRGLADTPVADEALSAYLAGEAAARGIAVRNAGPGQVELRFADRGRRFVAIVEEEARGEAVLAIPTSPGQQTLAREVRPGDAPSIDVSPYWFGRALGSRSAVTAVQHESQVPSHLLASGAWSPADQVQAYIVFYELPGARGDSSAIPGRGAPAGEFQVVSQSIVSAAARLDLDTFDGKLFDGEGVVWERSEIVLANGEPAVVYVAPSEDDPETTGRFAVATEKTLVNVSGTIQRADVAALASALRPIGR